MDIKNTRDNTIETNLNMASTVEPKFGADMAERRFYQFDAGLFINFLHHS